MSFVVDKDGTVSGCKVDNNVDYGPNFDPCKALQGFEPRLDDQGQPIRVRVVNSNVTRIFQLPDGARPVEE